MKSVVSVRLSDTKSEHRCYLCEEVIASGPVSRVAWGGVNPGFGFFHVKFCSEAIITRLRKDYEIVYDSDSERDDKTGTQS